MTRYWYIQCIFKWFWKAFDQVHIIDRNGSHLRFNTRIFCHIFYDFHTAIPVTTLYKIVALIIIYLTQLMYNLCIHVLFMRLRIT